MSFIPVAIAYLAGVSSSALGNVFSDAIKNVIKNIFNARSGYEDAANNSCAFAAHQHMLQAINRCFENDTIKSIHFESAECAIWSIKGEGNITLDFRRPNDQMFDAILYVLAKDMIGVCTPEEIYSFLKKAKGDNPLKLTDINHLHNFMKSDETYAQVLERRNDDHKGRLLDAIRVYTHAQMRCGWARRTLNNRNGVSVVNENLCAVLDTFAQKDNHETNLSRNGILAFLSDGNIMVKPMSDSENKHIAAMNKGIKGAAVDENGNDIDGHKGIERYRMMRLKIIAENINQLIDMLKKNKHRDGPVNLQQIRRSVLTAARKELGLPQPRPPIAVFVFRL